VIRFYVARARYDGFLLADRLNQLGIRAHGMSPFTTTYIRFGREVSTDVPPSDHVMYETGVRVTPTGRASS